MTTYIALFRAVNLGGKSAVSSSALRGIAESIGFHAARTLLQSGNLLFSTSRAGTASIESALESEAARIGLRTHVVVRSAAEWERVIAANPFPTQALGDPRLLHVMPLKRAPRAEDVRALQSGITGPETLEAVGAQLYVVYPEGSGRSKLTLAVIEKRLATRGTARNWNTVLKLAAAAAAGTGTGRP